MILYQRDNSSQAQNNDIKIYDNFEYIPHLHRDFELVYVLSGTVGAYVEGRRFEVKEGEILLVLSNQIHYYVCDLPNRAVVHVFSADNVPSFARAVSGKYCDDPIFTCDPDAANYYLKCCIEKEERSSFALKSYLYAICGQFLQKCILSDGIDEKSDILHRMLAYVSEHFEENITLYGMASELGYETHYLSRVFSRAVGMNIKNYINLYRVDMAKNLLVSTNRSVTDIALACGFQSIRNFNRVFLSETGMTPQDYRRSAN